MGMVTVAEVHCVKNDNGGGSVAMLVLELGLVSR